MSGRQLSLSLAIGFTGFASQVAMTKGMQQEKSATGSLVRQSLCPIFALLWQWLCFPQDVLAWTSFAGFGTILLGLTVTVVAKAYREEVKQQYDVVPDPEVGTSGLRLGRVFGLFSSRKLVEDAVRNVGEDAVLFGKRRSTLRQRVETPGSM